MNIFAYIAAGFLLLVNIPVTTEPKYPIADEQIIDSQAEKDAFPVYVNDETNQASLIRLVTTDVIPRKVESTSYIDLSKEVVNYELPLKKIDYYAGKYLNARAGVKETQKIPILSPGDRVRLIGDGIITVSPVYGYVKPVGYYYGSGLCWTVSTLGGIIDQANIEFRNKYGMDLFVFRAGDRSPHDKYYSTYAPSNHGYGYSVYRVASGKGTVDYTFQVNPELKNHSQLNGIKLKIELSAINNHPTAYNGESISAKLYSNFEF